MAEKDSRPFFGNDLEGPVAAHHPEISRLVTMLGGAKGVVQAGMSGSGSAVFGLFSRQADARRAAVALAGPGRRIVQTRTLDRKACQRLAAK